MYYFNQFDLINQLDHIDQFEYFNQFDQFNQLVLLNWFDKSNQFDQVPFGKLI